MTRISKSKISLEKTWREETTQETNAYI